MILRDVKVVLDNIEDFLESPQGVVRLKNMVLKMAASGRLVAQNPDEGSATSLRKTIEFELPNAQGAGRKNTAHLPKIPPDEIPFSIPESWEWVRLGTIINFKVGKTPPRKEPEFWSNAEIPWVSIADLIDQGKVTHTKESINSNALNKIFRGYIAPAGTLLFSFKLTIGKMSILDIDACHNEAIAAFFVHDTILRDYLFKILPVLNLTGRSSSAIKGNTLNSQTIPLIEVPLPPLNEQKRIVDKVDEIFKLIDTFTNKKVEREKSRSRLTKSAMHSLGFGDASVALKNLEELVKTRKDLEDLEKGILTLAISGRLISQNASEGDANDAYPHVQRDGLGRKKKDSVIMPEDIKQPIFSIPHSWKWVSLGDICGFEYGFTDSAKDAGDARFVRITDMGTDCRLIQTDQKFIHLNDESRKALLKKDDVLVARIGATFGRTILFKEQYPAVYASYLIRISFDHQFLNPDFYWIFAQSNAYWDQALALVSGSAQPQFNANLIKKILIPVPPLAEQTRIVKEVQKITDLLMPLKSILDK